jgi:hypothetical protein
MNASAPCDFVVVHATEGRLRLRRTVQARLSLADGARAVCSLPGVRHVRFADLTGSLIIEHDYDAESELLATLEAQHDIVVTGEWSVAPYAPVDVQSVVDDLDQAVDRLSGGEFDLNALFSATLLGLGLLQFRNGKFLPAGLTLLLQANSYFRPPPATRDSRH